MKNNRKKEIWLPIEGTNSKYYVSNQGNVMTKRQRKGILALTKQKSGYYYAMIEINGQRKNCRVHRLVAMAFIPNPDNLEMVNHKDENKANNNVENLEWCTRSYNQTYSLSLHPERRYVFGNNFKDKKTGENLSPRTKHLPIKHFRKVEQRTLDDEYIRTFDSFAHATGVTGVPSGSIKHSCDLNASQKQRRTHKNWISRSCGYIWRYAER